MQYKTESDKQANKQNKLEDTDSGMMVTRGEAGWGKDEEGKGGQIFSDERGLCMVVTQCNIHMIYYRMVMLKLT